MKDEADFKPNLEFRIKNLEYGRESDRRLPSMASFPGAEVFALP
jgi:hypothetical protein